MSPAVLGQYWYGGGGACSSSGLKIPSLSQKLKKINFAGFATLVQGKRFILMFAVQNEINGKKF